MKNNTLIMGILVIVVGVGAFFGGMQYQKTKSTSQFAAGQFGGAGLRGGAGGGRTGGTRPVAGEVLSSDNNSVTVKLQDGSSKIVLVSSSTTINKADQAAMSDIKTGERISAYGQTNADGSVTAQNIQINPMFGGGPGRGASPTASPTQ